jgi:hypothetical protein
VLRQQNLDFLGDDLMMSRDFSSGVFSTGSSVAIPVSGDRFDELVRARPAPRCMHSAGSRQGPTASQVYWGESEPPAFTQRIELADPLPDSGLQQQAVDADGKEPETLGPVGLAPCIVAGQDGKLVAVLARACPLAYEASPEATRIRKPS